MIAQIPATGKYAELINHIYKQALKLTTKETCKRIKYVSIGDVYKK